MNDVSQIFVLLLAFQIKQLLCDYPIQPEFLLKRFQSSSVNGLLLYSFFHGFFTLAICLILTTASFPLAAGLALLDVGIDFVLGLTRSKSDLLARFRPLDLQEFTVASRKAKRQHRLYWIFFGIDQALHHMTHFSIVYILSQQGVVWMM